MSTNAVVDSGVAPSPAVVPTLAARLRSGVSWSLAGAVVNSGINVLLAIGLARVLGKEGFGGFAITQSTMLTAAGVAQLATGYTANKYVAEFHGVDKQRTGRIIGFCAIVSGVTATMVLVAMLVSAPWVAAHALDRPEIAPNLMAAAGMVFFSVLNGYQLGTMAGLEGFRRMARALAAGAVANCVVCLAGAWRFGLLGASVGLSVGACFQWLVYRVVMRLELQAQDITPVYRGLRREREIFFHFALPAAISGFVSMPAIWLANSILIRQSNGVGQMGLFAAANSLRSVVLFLPLILNRVTTTLLNKQRGLNDSVRYHAVFRMNLIAAGGIAIAGAVGVAVAGPLMLRAYGKDFSVGYPVLLVLLLAAVFEVIFQAVYQLVQSHGKMWLSFGVVVIPRDVSIVLLALFLVPAWGVVGLACAYGASWLIGLTLVAVLTRRMGLVPVSA